MGKREIARLGQSYVKRSVTGELIPWNEIKKQHKFSN